MYHTLFIDAGSWYHFKNDTGKNVSVNPGEIKVVTYKSASYMNKLWNTEVPYTDVLDIRDVWEIDFDYLYLGKYVGLIHHIRGGEYWSIKLDTSHKNSGCKSPGFFLLLQITLHLQSEGYFS